MGNLYEAAKPYRDRTGLLTPDCQEPGYPLIETGNNLYTWLFFIQLVKRGEARGQEILNEFLNIADKLWVRPSPLLPYVYYGLMNRASYKLEEQEGPDDYIGLCVASKLMQTPIHRYIYEYGSRGAFYWSRWEYNNLTPGHWTPSSWFGRQGQVVAHFYHCLNKPPGVLLTAWWGLSLMLNGRVNKTDTSSRILAWLLIQGHHDEGFISEWVKESWYTRLAQDFPRGMKEVVEKHLGAEHPLAIYWVD